MGDDKPQFNLPRIELADIEEGWVELLTGLDQPINLAAIDLMNSPEVGDWLMNVRKVRYVVHSFAGLIQAEPALQMWLKRVWLSMLADTLRVMGTTIPHIPTLDNILQHDVPSIFGMPYDKIEIETIYGSDGDRLGLEFIKAGMRINRDKQELAKNPDYMKEYVEAMANENLHLLGILSQGVPFLLQMLSSINNGLINQSKTLEERSQLFIDLTSFVATLDTGLEKKGFVDQDTIEHLAEIIKREYLGSDPTEDLSKAPLIIMFDEMVGSGVTIRAILTALQAQLNLISPGFGNIALGNTSFYVMGQKWECTEAENRFIYSPVGASSTRPIEVKKV